MPKQVHHDGTTHLVDDYGPAIIETECGQEFDRDDHNISGGGLPDDVCGNCERSA